MSLDKLKHSGVDFFSRVGASWKVGVQTKSAGSVARTLGLQSEETIDPQDVTADSYATLKTPGGLGAFVVHEDPDIWLLHHVLTSSEIAHIIELSAASFERSEVTDEGPVYTFFGDYGSTNFNRTSFSASIDVSDSPVLSTIGHRLCSIVGAGLEEMEPLQVVRYTPGQYFAPHNDGLDREWTIFIYLSDLPEDGAGETCFPALGFKVIPRKGCAVVWRNYTDDGEEDARTTHQGLPPTSGLKYGLNCWFTFRTA